MRRTIDTAPKDGKFVILEDDASGSFELAQWSAKARAWVKENGELSKITPTYWQVDPVTVARLEALAAQDKSERPRARRWFAVSSIAAAMVAASLIGLYLESGMADLRQSLQKEHDRAEALAGELAKTRRDIKTLPSKTQDQAAQRNQAAEKATASLRQSLKTEQDRAEALTGELAKARRDLETQLALSNKAGDEVVQLKQLKESAQSTTVELRQSLQKEHDRAEALASELAMARRDIDTQVALASKMGDESVKLKQTAESATAELRQSLQKEHDRAEALASELAKTRRDIKTQPALPSKTQDQAAQRNQAAEKATASLRQSLKTEQDRAAALTGELAKARRDLETQLALSNKAGDEVVQLKQLKESAQSTTVELRQSLQKEHDRAEALASELAMARRDIDTQVALASKMGDESVKLKQTAESATAELRQSLQAERNRAEALASELAMARRDIDTQLALASKMGDEIAQLKQAAESAPAELRQSLQMEHDRAEALSRELARAQRDLETQLALSSKAGEEAVQLKQLKEAAESTTAELRQSLQKEHDKAEVLSSELARAQRDTEMQLALLSKADDEAAQLKQLKAAESATAELRQSLQKEHERAEALSSELARARRDTETQVALSSKAGDEAAQVKKAAESATAELRQSLKTEYDRAEALTGELARVRRDRETQLALSSKASQEAAQVKKATESATAELRQSLQKEHQRAEALTSELARAQRDIETQVALASKWGDEAAQLKQLKEAAESTTAELRQSLQQVRNQTEPLAPRRESTQTTIGQRIEVEPASNSPIAQATQAAEAAATEQPAAAEAQGSPAAARLLARANALISQGNIGAARIVLERAVENGNAQASFMLAETYDPLVLSTWKTYGTRGDVTKARELYAKALAGGIQEAKDRSVALR